MTKHGLWRMGIIDISSISGIELALWNILSNHLGVPVRQLLDGSVRESLSILGLGPAAVLWYGDVVHWPIEGRAVRWDMPQRPGLGIEVDANVIDAHPFQPDILHAREAIMSDGTVVPW